MATVERLNEIVANYQAWLSSGSTDSVLSFLSRYAHHSLSDRVEILLLESARLPADQRPGFVESCFAEWPELLTHPELRSRLQQSAESGAESPASAPELDATLLASPAGSGGTDGAAPSGPSGPAVQLGRFTDRPSTASAQSSNLDAALESTISSTRGPAAAATRQTVGDYELLGEIARGGMGVVYKARHRHLDRLAAIKLIKSGELADDDEVRRFHVEAQAAACLDHPGIVPVYEVGEQDGQHFLALAYIDGQSLWHSVKQSPLPPREAARLIEQVATAIHYAHERGIVHRDLKPQNILINSQGHPKVTDFGLAKKQERDSGLTATGQVLGTPGYMPPEQVNGHSELVGPLADVYSLGATLYCLLSGRPPFQAATAVETMLQVLKVNPVPPRQLNPAIPQDLETICLKCLEKTPAQRYATAQELADELGRFLRGETIQARPVSRAEWLRRWCVRNPLVAGLGGLALVLLISGTVISSSFAWLASQRAVRAEEGTRIAIGMLETVVIEMQDRLRSIPAAREARLQILKQSLKEMDTLANLQVQSDRLDLSRAVVLTRFGDVIFEMGSDQALGSLDSADKYLETALEIFSRCAASQPGSVKIRKQWAHALTKSADIAVSRHQIDRARDRSRRAIELYRGLIASEEDDVPWLKQLSYSLTIAGDAELYDNDAAKALPLFREAIEVAEPLHQQFPDDPDCYEYLIVAAEKSADAQLRLGDSQSAHETYAANLIRARDYLQRDPSDSLRQYCLSFSLERMAESAVRLGQPENAVSYYQQELEALLAAIATDPNNVKFQQEIQMPLGKYAGLCHQLERSSVGAEMQQRVQAAIDAAKAAATKTP